MVRSLWPSALVALAVPYAGAYSLCAPSAATRAAVAASPAAATRARPLRCDANGDNSGLGGVVRDLGGLWDRLRGAETDLELAAAQGANVPLAPQSALRDNTEFDLTDPDEYVPLVLVIGATGRTGKVITRKLVLRGFRVAVLVRSLSTDTLTLLGSGVSYSYGDVTDYRSLLNAMEDVDKIVFVASTSDPEDELVGLRNVVRAFQDTRTFIYGEAEATKRSLFKFSREADFERWAIESADDGVSQRLASAGLSAQPSIAYWKRSDAHSNAVFVGKVFDPYLGSATVASKLNSVGGVIDAGNDGLLELGEFSGVIVKAIGDGQNYTVVLRTDLYEAEAVEYRAHFETTKGEFVSARLPFASFKPHRNGQLLEGGAAATLQELNRHSLAAIALGFFPQLNSPATCDGGFYLSLAFIKTYRERDEPEMIYLSTASAPRSARALAAAEEAAALGAAPDSELSEQQAAAASAEALAGASAILDAEELGEVEKKSEGAVEASEGEGVPTPAESAQSAEGAAGAATAATAAAAAAHADDGEKDGDNEDAPTDAIWADRCERVIRGSGLTYFIVRPAALSDRPGGVRRLEFAQSIGGRNEQMPGMVSRVDVAEVIVRSLLDPRACNVACSLAESAYLPSGQSQQDISQALEVLLPEG